MAQLSLISMHLFGVNLPYYTLSQGPGSTDVPKVSTLRTSAASECIEQWVEATLTGGCLGMVDPPRLLYIILIYVMLLEGCTCCSCRMLRQVKNF